ncbi:ankyrin repeat domain-containing protein [Rickettsiales endosymbiont of Stachyamoeba lipophora]|uniref:ankyrin repeat domain-containing protein n=1 Tax=Rickettsiales endosymbiont of Stachyamoeba lipophora TaxID=2486578 RepID=UPI000F64943E|nr:ankyrin repeat domain-containing protein [Rickettsiales endosymbiont of Stachyamoeba lipophora]AZL16282.1 ankyrin repeat domain-containing protein [Rickettsiales endosymbiont of Stachyamoeba lipophora]
MAIFSTFRSSNFIRNLTNSVSRYTLLYSSRLYKDIGLSPTDQNAFKQNSIINNSGTETKATALRSIHSAPHIEDADFKVIGENGSKNLDPTILEVESTKKIKDIKELIDKGLLTIDNLENIDLYKLARVTDNNERTLLHYYTLHTKKVDRKIMHIFLINGFKPDQRDVFRNTPIHYALQAEEYHPEQIYKIIQNYSSTEMFLPNNIGETLLQKAVEKQDPILAFTICNSKDITRDMFTAIHNENGENILEIARKTAELENNKLSNLVYHTIRLTWDEKLHELFTIFNFPQLSNVRRQSLTLPESNVGKLMKKTEQELSENQYKREM